MFPKQGLLCVTYVKLIHMYRVNLWLISNYFSPYLMHGKRVRRDGAVYLFTKLPPQIKIISKGNLKEPRQKLMGTTRHSLGQNKVHPVPLLSETVENF